jgi:hypothetical protein
LGFGTILSCIRSPAGIIIKGIDVITTTDIKILNNVGKKVVGSSEMISLFILCIKMMDIKSPMKIYSTSTIDKDIRVALTISVGSDIESCTEKVKGTSP